MEKQQNTIEIKVWDMDGGNTWIAAERAGDAVRCFAETLGYDWENGGARVFQEDYPDCFEDVKELTKDQMESLIFVKEWEGVIPADDEGTMTFKERLEGLVKENTPFPVFFATSEY